MVDKKFLLGSNSGVGVVLGHHGCDDRQLSVKPPDLWRVVAVALPGTKIVLYIALSPATMFDSNLSEGSRGGRLTDYPLYQPHKRPDGAPCWSPNNL